MSTLNLGNITGGLAYNDISAFVPTKYSLQFIRKFYLSSITNYICNRNWEGDITGPGTTVRLRKVPDIVVSAGNNSGDVQWQSIQADAVSFTINWAFQGAFWILDRERATIDVDAEGVLVMELEERLRLAVESTILSTLYADAYWVVTCAASGTNNVGGVWGYSGSTTYSVQAVNLAQSFLDTGLGGGIDVAPREGRYLVIHPSMLPGLASQPAFYALNAGTPKGALYSGFLAEISGLNVLMSPLIPGAGTSASKYHCLVGHPEGVTMGVKYGSFATNIPLQDKFGVGTRAENYFGYLTTKSDFLVDLEVQMA